MSKHREFRSYLIDIEGVLVRDKRYRPVAGSVAWFNGLPERDIDYCLVSNNTTHRPSELVDDLAAAGFTVDPQRLVTALELGVDLLERWDKRRVLWLGASRLRGFWRERGFELTGEGEPGGDPAGETAPECQAVVLGANSQLQVADLDRALPALLDQRAELVALHRNLFFLDETGRRRFGPGAWCAALETVLGSGRAICVGKPGERIYREALKRVVAPAAEALFISDDPAADLVTAKRLGMGTAFCLSGKYPDHGVLGTLDQEEWPDLVCDRPETLS